MSSSPPDTNNQTALERRLERELREWWEQKNDDWGSEGGGGSGQAGDEELWDRMPKIDSKAVTRVGASISSDFPDIDFDPSMVQEGGYSSIDELVDDLVPKLLEAAQDESDQEND